MVVWAQTVAWVAAENCSTGGPACTMAALRTEPGSLLMVDQDAQILWEEAQMV